MMFATMLLPLCLGVGETPKVLLVAAERNPTALALRALGVNCDRVEPSGFAARSPFDYDLIIWGMDETRAPLARAAEAMAAFVAGGGFFLGFRCQEAEPWLPAAAAHDKAYQLGEILAPGHPIFTTPHRFTTAELAEVHGGSVYRAFHRLAPGWTPLVSTGAEQAWDQTPAAEPGEHYGVIEWTDGTGHLLLVQLIPEYHWFRDRDGEPDCAGARWFENLVRYALATAPTTAARRPPRVVPDGFHAGLERVLALPRRGDGVALDDAAWRFDSHGPYAMKVDRRGVLTFTHADTPAVPGSYAELRRRVTVPAGAGSVRLRWYESDTYCGGREIVLGGPRHGQTALENYKRGVRFAQVLVNGEVVWEEDVLGRNPQPAWRCFRSVDITPQVRGAADCEVTLRVEDRADTGEGPFAIDVFFATVELLADLRQEPAETAFAPDGFEPVGDGAVALTGPRGRLTTRHTGAAGRYAVAVRLRDEHTGRSLVRLRAGERLLAEWRLTADDHQEHWAVAPAAELAAGIALAVEAERDGTETVRIAELAVIPESLLAGSEPTAPAAPPRPEPVRQASFTVTVPETAGTARQDEVTAQGLPFPLGCVTDPSAIAVLDDRGAAVPLQTRLVAPWPDGSAKVVLVAFPATVGAGDSKTYRVVAGEGAPAPPAPTRPLTVTETGDRIQLDTGLITVAIDRGSGRILDEVRRGERVLKPTETVWDLTLADEEGRLWRSDGRTVERCEVVERGPLRALVLRTGTLADERGGLVDYRIQLVATAGSDAIGVTTTIVNRQDRDIYLRRWSLGLPAAGAETSRVWLGPEENASAAAGAVLYQHREDRLTWTGPEGGREWADGRAPGRIRLPGAWVGVRWFWERFPQAIRFDQGVARFDFIPEPHDERDLPTRWRDRLLELTERFQVGGVGYPQVPGKMGLFCLSVGEALSQELRLVFDGDDGDDAAAPAPLVAPLRAVPEPAYTASTTAFGEFAPRDPDRFPRYEDSVEATYRGYLAKREQRREYGFENFGDDTFEWGYGPSYTYWSNSEYDHHHAWALQYLRSADPRWWELCEQTARHYRDVVVIHHGANHGGPHHHNATNLWMPQHEEQCWIADHTLAGAHSSHAWAEGLIDYWFLTGDPWTGEVVREMADWYLEIVNDDHYGAGGQERGPGWALIALSSLYRALGDERLREAGDRVAQWLIDWQDPIRGVISVPISEQPSYEGGTSFMHGIVGRGLGRWYDVTGDPRVREAAVGIAEWLTTEPMGEPGTFWYKQSPQNSRRYGADSQCIGALSYAYKLTGDPWFAAITQALLEKTGAGSRSMAWYPHSLAHL